MTCRRALAGKNCCTRAASTWPTPAPSIPNTSRSWRALPKVQRRPSKKSSSWFAKSCGKRQPGEAARRLGEAMNVCMLPQRASNYNNVIADLHGEVYSMEGSATDYEPVYIAEDILAHANHYATPAMRKFDYDRNAIADSVIRHNRA